MLSTFEVDDVLLRLRDHVAHEIVDHAANGFVEHSPGAASSGYRSTTACVKAREHANVEQFLDADQPGPHTIVEVVIVVGDLVGQVGDLRFEPGLSALQKASPSSPSAAHCARSSA